jgi:hypothetical protein
MNILGVVASSMQGVSGSFESIATANGTGSSSTITFSSIPSTYKHLQIRGIARLTGDTSPSPINIQYNGVTTSTYFNHRLTGDGTSAGVNSNASNTRIFTAARAISNGETANAFGAFIIDIHDYYSTSKTKTLRSFFGNNTNSGSSNDAVGMSSGASTATTAISSISIIASSGSSFTTTSVFSLYGIKG